MVDYLNPQLYWRIDKKEQSFPVLLKWWTEQNPQGRHLWPGMIVKGPTELTNQIAVTRAQPGTTGHVIFKATSVVNSTNGVDAALAEAYTVPALIPTTPWLGTNTPAATELSLKRKRYEVKLAWKPLDDARWWLVQQQLGSNWTTEILPGSETNYVIKATNSAALPEHVYISAVNRLGNIGGYAAK